MKELSDLVGKSVTVERGGYDDIEGTLLSIADRGYFVRTEDGDYYFVPELNNVIGVCFSEE